MLQSKIPTVAISSTAGTLDTISAGEWQVPSPPAALSADARPTESLLLQRLEKFKLPYVYNAEFSLPNADSVILGPYPIADHTPRRSVAPKSVLDPYLRALYDIALLTPEQERFLFRQYNYLKFKLASALEQHGSAGSVDEKAVDAYEPLFNQAMEIRNRLVEANLRLVVSIAKKFRSEPLHSLVSDGNEILLKTVERFDYGLNFKFSTYASWALRNSFYRSLAVAHKHQSRFRSGTELPFTPREDERSVATADEQRVEAATRLLDQLLKGLEDREVAILKDRFGLGQALNNPLTLKEVGERHKLTKERIRQLEVKAKQKLASFARWVGVDAPDDVCDAGQECDWRAVGDKILSFPSRSFERRILEELHACTTCSLGELKALVAPKMEKEVVRALEQLMESGLVVSAGRPTLYCLPRSSVRE